MQISKLENDKASGKLNLDALKRKNYKQQQNTTVEKKKETPIKTKIETETSPDRSELQPTQSSPNPKEHKKKNSVPGWGQVIEVVPK